MVDKLESIADIEASFDRARAYLRSEGWPDDHGAIGYMAVVALLAGYERRSATPANGEQVEREDAAVAAIEATGLLAGDEARDAARAALAAAPTEDARERVQVLEEALERAKHKLGHVTVDGMGGDNLAVTLCTHFDDGEGDEDEHGWTEAATSGCDATLEAIHAMYADVLRTALGNKETDRADHS